MSRSLACLAAALTVGLIAASPARAAGGYTVLSCSGPDGRPLPNAGDGRYGWQPAIGGQFTLVADRCASEGTLTIQLGLDGSASYGRYGQWAFVAPPHTSIRAYSIAWWGVAGGWTEASISRSDQPDPIYVRRYGGAFASAARPETVAESGLDLSALRVLSACSFNTAGCSGRRPLSEIYVGRTVVELADVSHPSGSAAGSLVEAERLASAPSAAVVASDRGGGVYRLLATIDGEQVASVPAAPGVERCADVAPGGDPYEFASPRPCPEQVSRELTLQTERLPEGRGTLRLYVEDAAGNRTAIHGPRAVLVDNVPDARHDPAPAAGAPEPPATDRLRLELFFASGRPARPRRGATLHQRYGERLRLMGRLMSIRGRPVAGARLHLQRRRRGSRRWFERLDATTHDDGRFQTVLGRAASERIRVAYYARGSDEPPLVSRTLIRRSLARLSLAIPRRVVRGGEPVALHGRLHGPRPPRDGVMVLAQLRGAHAWTALGRRRVAADRRAFSIAVRLPTDRPGRQLLRLLALAAPGWPLDPGASRALSVTAIPRSSSHNAD